MVVKTITVTEDAYILAREAKFENESFSDLLKRTFTRKRLKIADLLGIMGESEEEAEAMKKRVKAYRKEVNKNMEERYARFRNIRAD